MNNFFYAGESDPGYGKEIQEDYIAITELDDDVLLSILADGAGSHGQSIQPAMIVVNTLRDLVRDAYRAKKEVFLMEPEYFMHQAILMTNRVLGAFSFANEEQYAGFACALTCCLTTSDGHMYFAHCGHTRLYLIRLKGKDKIPTITQLTRDHTAAVALVDSGEITAEEYHVHPGRLQLTSGLGVTITPEIQIFQCVLKPNDILLLTSDGIHAAIRTTPLMEIVLSGIITEEACTASAKALIDAAKLLKMNDNMSVCVLYYLGPSQNTQS